jgi:TonB family protein
MDTNDTPAMPGLRLLLPDTTTNFKTVFGGAGVTHVVFVLLLVAVAWGRPDRPTRSERPALIPDLVFLDMPGPGGGGGGGGNESLEPARQEDVPAVEPPEAEPLPVAEPEPTPAPEPEPVIPEAPLVPTKSPVAVLATAPAVLPTTASLGTGRGGGADSGQAGGIGPGDGRGIGPGEEQGLGGDVYRPGSGVEPPVDIFKARPEYTPQAVLARVQGAVLLDCVVLATGTVGECDIVRSLDSNAFGLDDKALEAARKFVFRPGTRQGEPVAVQVHIELTFNLR